MSHLTIYEFIEQNNIKVDNLYVDIVYEDKWIYINDDLLKLVGCSTIRELSEYLTPDYFKETDDYKYIEASELDDSYVIFGDGQKPSNDVIRYFIVVSSICFRELLILINTTESKKVSKDYRYAELAYKQYMKYLSQFKDDEAVKLSDRLSLVNRSYFICDQYVYVMSNNDDASKNIFRVGIAESDKALQKISYHTSYNYVYLLKCVDAPSLYQTLLIWLNPFKYNDHGDFTSFQIHFDTLKKFLSIFENLEGELLDKVVALYSDYYISSKDALDPLEFNDLVLRDLYDANRLTEIGNHRTDEYVGDILECRYSQQ